ncbi:MAG: hypothetical protein KDC06_06365 [Chitinophagaceae bacterium]|nr:hypothetical protein [Chitinophagaceae bacterium]
MKKLILFSFYFLLLTACQNSVDNSRYDDVRTHLPDKFLVVLGIAQDAGYPQLGCTQACCRAYWEGKEKKKHTIGLAIVDRLKKQYWLLEASPDIREELHTLQAYLPEPGDYTPDGIFITHAHIGHYTGLLQFGREAMGAHQIPVFTMPRLDSFLRRNGPWNQLVRLKNIDIHPLQAEQKVDLGDDIQISPMIVPHRDEYSETVGFMITSAQKKILFIPDIDKWEKWNQEIQVVLQNVDLAFIDGTFYQNGELPGRDMSVIPHPFVVETMEKLQSLPKEIRHKVVFIHFNHTNPLLKTASKQKEAVIKKGFRVAEEGMLIHL